MKAQHTPGPWTHEGHGDITGIENDPDIGFVGKVDIASVYLRAAAYRHEANSRLIAAAPDLLSVLKELQASAAYWSEYDVPLGIVDRINAAIAKATGKTE
jgi:hypothetical protein